MFFFFFKQKTAYEMRISDWSSDVCSSDLRFRHPDLRVSFAAPSGFGMENGASAVTIAGSGGQAQFSAAPYSGDLSAYIDSVFAKLGGGNGGVPPGEIRRTTVNGLPAAWRTIRAEPSPARSMPPSSLMISAGER